MIRKQSKNKCYPEDVCITSITGNTTMCYPKINNNPLLFKNENRVIRYDQFSKASVVSSSFSYEGDKDELCATMDGIDAMRFGLDILKSSKDAIETELYTGLKYKYLYQLSLLILKKEVNRIDLYCPGIVSNSIDNPMFGKYFIVVSGMCDNRCKIDFEIITDYDFRIHPSLIYKMIEDNSKDLPISVNIDQDSFNSAIKQMGYDNPYNKDNTELTTIDILNALDAIDKK